MAEMPRVEVLGAKTPETKVLGKKRLGLKGNAPGNARGRPRRLYRKEELRISVCSAGFSPARCG